MKTITFEDVVNMHIDAFGVEPKITGIDFIDSDSLIDKIIEAINNKEPYVEKQVKEGVLT